MIILLLIFNLNRILTLKYFLILYWLIILIFNIILLNMIILNLFFSRQIAACNKIRSQWFLRFVILILSTLNYLNSLEIIKMIIANLFRILKSDSLAFLIHSNLLETRLTINILIRLCDLLSHSDRRKWFRIHLAIFIKLTLFWWFNMIAHF